MPRAFLQILMLLLIALAWSGAHFIAAQESAEPAGAPEVAKQQEPLRRERSLLPSEPKTPEEFFEAVDLLADLGRPDLAKPYLDKLMTILDDATLLKLRDERGPAEFLKLANIKELQPQTIDLMNRANALFVKSMQDPARLKRLIAELRGTAGEQAVAMDQLRLSGEIAVPPLLAAVAERDNADINDRLILALVRIGRPAVAPLVGALDSPNAQQRVAAIQALGRIDSDESIPFLWYSAADTNELEGVRSAARQALVRLLKRNLKTDQEFSTVGVSAQLKRLALEHFRHAHAWMTGPDGLVPQWTWERPRGTLVLKRVDPRTASDNLAAKFAREALVLSPTNEEIQALSLCITLALEATQGAGNAPIPSGSSSAHDLALSVGPDVVSRAVSQSMELGSGAGAAAGLSVLGQIGSVQQLQAKKGERSPLLVALNYPDFRVQFAAATAILQLDPPQAFAAAPQVVDVLSRAISDAGDGLRKAIVIDAVGDRGSRMAGLLGELNYEATAVSTGREGFRLAASRSDTDLVMIDANVIRWGLSETLANFQADSRTAGIPVLVYGPETARLKIRHVLAKNRRIQFIAEPLASRDLGSDLEQFLGSLQAPPSTPSERQQQAESAAYWLAYIAQGQREKIFNLAPAETHILAALENPKLSHNALIAVGAIPTRNSQDHLADVALDRRAELSLRRQAALELATHIHRHSLLLSDDAIRKLHSEWSSATDSELRSALGGVIGSLKPNPELVGKRLRDYNRPPGPTPPLVPGSLKDAVRLAAGPVPVV